MRKNYHLISPLVVVLLTVLGGTVCSAEIVILEKEVVSRETSLYVGGIADTPSKDAASREVTVQMHNGPAEPYSQIVSRETDVVVYTATVPDPVAGVNVDVSPTGEEALLDWAHYIELAQHDVVNYRIYVSDQPFTNVTAMTPYITLPAGTYSLLISGLEIWQDHYFVVVAVDILGGFNPVVSYSAAYVLSPEVVSREFSISVGSGLQLSREEVVSRELDMVVASDSVPQRVSDFNVDVSPTGDSALLDWSAYNALLESDVVRYDIYYSSTTFTNVTAMVPYVQVAAGTTSILLEGLALWADHYFAVVPVDVLGGFDPIVNYGAAYALSPETISREFSLFVGKPNAVSRDSVSRELVMLGPDDTTPAPVTGLGSGFMVLSSTTAYQALDLDWTSYDEIAQRDVVRYRVYVGASYFDDVTSMEPFTYAPAGSGLFTLTGLDAYGIYYVAVIAEDVLGNYDTVVRSVSSQSSTAGVGEVLNLSVVCGEYSLVFHWDEPADASTFLDYYALYFGGALMPQIVASTSTTFEVTGLEPAHGYPLRITTVDIFDFESGGASLLAATWLPNPSNLVVGAWTNELTLTWDASVPDELLSYYDVYQDMEVMTNVTGRTPVRTTTTTNITIDAFENYTNYYFTVVAVNIAAGYNPEVVPVLPDSDLDNDGLMNDDEVDVYGTDPYDEDTDHDGLSDYEEICITNTDPLNPDMDDDQLLDGAEIVWGTDPEIRDSDLDLLGDGWEVEYGLNPLVIDNITLDVDGDGEDYYAEYLADTNPTNSLSVFQISGIIPGPPIEVFFYSSAHRVYSLLWQTNLFTTGWILHDTSQDVRGSGVESSLPDPPPVAGPRFYKVSVDLP